jgi:hypothetical protein
VPGLWTWSTIGPAFGIDSGENKKLREKHSLAAFAESAVEAVAECESEVYS